MKNSIDRIAFFDVDNTIYDGYTASELLTYLQKKKVIHESFMANYELVVERYRKREISYSKIIEEVWEIISQGLEGQPVALVKQYSQNMLLEKEHVFRDWFNSVFTYLKKNGFEVVLVSAGPDIVISDIAAMLGITEYIATQIPHDNRNFNGKSAKIVNDLEKVSTIQKYLKSEPELSIAFGDSPGDAAMLAQVDLPFVFDNAHHKEIVEIAKQEGWSVFSEAAEVINQLELKLGSL